jgi:hypothetical protein
MNSRFQLLAAVLLVVLVSGCGGNITNPMSSLNPGALTADFPDGREFLSGSAKVSDQSNIYLVSATQDASGLPQDEISISIPKGASLPYTVSSSEGADLIYNNVTTNVTNSYEANAAQGNCTITVTQLSPTFQGTFSGRVICNTISDSVLLSNGQFNATYN